MQFTSRNTVTLCGNCSNLFDVHAIALAHYPSYCSKYNLIERRFFPHLSRVCTGMLFDTLETVTDLMRKASTSTGLRTTVNVIRRLYETGRNATDKMKEQIRSTVEFAGSSRNAGGNCSIENAC
jgi:hypothetical protein